MMANLRWSKSSGGVVAGLMAGAVLGWAASGRSLPAAQAQGTGPAEASGTIAFTSGGGSSAQMLYVIDTKTQAFAVYRVEPQNGKGTVKLEAARQYRWDLKLAEYNNQPPDVASIESMVGSPRK